MACRVARAERWHSISRTAVPSAIQREATSASSGVPIQLLTRRMLSARSARRRGTLR